MANHSLELQADYAQHNLRDSTSRLTRVGFSEEKIYRFASVCGTFVLKKGWTLYVRVELKNMVLLEGVLLNMGGIYVKSMQADS